MFYNVLSELPFFDQFEKAKDKIAIDLGNLLQLLLEEENRNKDGTPDEKIDPINSAKLNVVGNKNDKQQKTNGKCKCQFK